MKVTALALDPIEKKPLARYKLGSMILSVGGLGCTMRCPWCQNHTIAQPEDPALVPVREMSIDELVEKARALVDEGNIGLAYAYNEPLVHWREVVECARAIHEAELDNVLVTNGLIAADKLEQLLPHIDAYNIDLKGFDQSEYDITGGKLNKEGYKSVAKQLMDQFGFEKVAITLRTSISASDNDWAGMLYDGKDFCFSKEYHLRIVDRVGGGDSFGGGLIYALLNGKSTQDAIEFAVAASALKHSIEGDFNRVTVAEVEKLSGGDGSGRVQR